MATQVTTAAQKTVSSKSPYTGSTFQRLTEELLGQDGYLSGGLTSDNGVTITVQPFKFVSRGIVGEALASSALDVPVSTDAWYVVASLPDDDPDSGIVVWITTSLAAAITGVVIAAKVGDVWRNPDAVDVKAAGERAAEAGAETGFSATYGNTGDVYDSADGTTVVDRVMANRGRIVGPYGSRYITAPIAGESARQIETTPVPASTIGDRSDRIVLRQREAFSSEISYLVGGMTNRIGQTISALGTGNGYSHWFGRADGVLDDQWMVWGNNTDLHIFGSFGDLVLLSGGSTIGRCQIVGQRTADSAIVVIYVDGNDLRMVSFNSTTGVIIDATTSLEALGNAINRFRAVLDQDENVRVVFEYDDGTTPSQQIYFGKFDTASASFGVAASTARYLELVNSGFNDTKPDIKVCRNGISHVVFIRGVGTDEFGDIRYVQLDSSDSVIDARTYSSATQVGTPDPLLELGIAQEAFDDFELVSLTVTPHDEVFAAVGARPAAEIVPKALLLFGPDLEDRTGFPLITLPQSVGAVERASIAIAHGDGGELYVSSRLTVDSFVTSHIGPQPGINGTSDFIIGESFGGESSVANASVGVFTVGFGPGGELVYVYDKGTNSITRDRRAAVADVVPGLHPNDVLLQTVNIALDAGGLVEEQSIEVLSGRKKGSKFPVVVGPSGDYQGYGSLESALSALSKEGGGEVVLRAGVHRTATSLLTVPSNVSLIGQPGATIDGSVSLTGKGLGAVTMFGNVMESATDFSAYATPGSWVLLAGVGGTGWHRIEKVLRNPTTGSRALLSNGIGGVAPVGTTAEIAASGLRLENLTVLGDLNLNRCRQCTFRNLSIVSNGSVFEGTFNYQCLFDNIDLLGAAASGAAFAVANGQYNTYQGLKLSDTRGNFEIYDTEEFPSLIGCKGDETNPALTVYDFLGSRTTPATILGCEGRFAATNLDWLVTNVGSVVRSPEGLGAMRLADDGTRAAGGDEAISLTGVAGDFNGATPNVLTDSVNERLKKAGDGMAGQLDLGTGLLGSVANGHVPRISAEVSLFAGVEYTLMWESLPSAGKAHRKYVKADGTVVETYNCSYSNTSNNWTKDVSGQNAAKVEFSDLGQSFFLQTTLDTFDDTTGVGGWGSGGAAQAAAVLRPTVSGAAAHGFEADGIVTVNDGLVAAANKNISLSGTGRLIHGTRYLEIHASAGMGYSAGTAPTLNTSFFYVSMNSIGAVWTIPVSLPQDVMITAIALFFDGGDTASKAFSLDYKTNCGLGVTNIASGTSILAGDQIDYMSGLTHVIGANEMIWCSFTAAHVLDRIAGIRVTYESPV